MQSVLRNLAVIFLACVWGVVPTWAGDGIPVTSMATTYTPATPSGPYNINGNTIYYGVGDNVRIDSVNAAGLTLTRSAISKPNISIQRINNATVSGERLTLFYPATKRGNDVFIQGDEAPSMEIAMNDDYLTSGGLDVFLNVDGSTEKANNIERVDFIVPAGINLPTTPSLVAEIGTVANEKHGNNSYKIALITSLDAFNQPNGYGPLRLIEGGVDHGNMGRPATSTGTLLRNAYTRNGTAPVGGGGNGPSAYIRSDTNFIGLSFISFAALGATAGQKVYGYSLFPNDMFDTNDLIGLTDAPLNTSGGVNGGDIYGGTFAIFSTPAAEAEASEGGDPNLQGNKTVEVFDPLSEGLYALPGNDVIYEISVTNIGLGSPDADSLFLVDELPSNVEFYNGDIDDAGPETDPVGFTDSGSTLTFNYATDVGFATGGTAPSSFAACSYTPAIGYDPNVTHVCINPGGTMAYGPANPSFSFKFRARIK